MDATIRIDTIEDFERVRSEINPVYITSKKHGKVRVPCASTLLVRTELVLANTYNPNQVPPDRLQLLIESILQNGFCFPIVVIFDPDVGGFMVIDGFHRKLVGGPEWLDFDYLPLVVLDHDITKRMTATMQFNRARGIHQVDLDAEVVRALVEQGMTEEDISTKLGMDVDTVHRYKQITGVASLFRNTDYSRAWEMVDDETEG